MTYHQLTHIERHNVHLSSVRDEADSAGMSVREYLELVGELISDEDCTLIVEDEVQ